MKSTDDVFTIINSSSLSSPIESTGKKEVLPINSLFSSLALKITQNTFALTNLPFATLRMTSTEDKPTFINLSFASSTIESTDSTNTVINSSSHT